MDDFSPEKIGRGCWFTLHKAAARANTIEKKNLVLGIIDMYKEEFPCEKCRNHFNKFIQEHNPRSMLSTEDGLFLWTWMCHNAANISQKKPIFPYYDAKTLYFDTPSCTSNCGHEDTNNNIVQKTIFHGLPQPVEKKKIVIRAI
jgi:hypothetical protein